MKAHVSTEPLSILLSPESKEDNATLSAFFAVVDRRPFVADEVVDVIGRPGGFGSIAIAFDPKVYRWIAAARVVVGGKP